MPEINSLDRLRMVAGKNPGCRVVDIIFRNPAIDPGTVPETVAPIGGIVALRTAAAAIEVVSSSLDDDGSPAGTGAQTIRVYGLDVNYVEISEDFVLNGTTAVTGTKQFFRINQAVVLTAGSGKTNAGNITIRDTGAGTTRSYIAASRSVSEVGVWTVPAGHKMYAQGWMIASRDATGNSSADVEFYLTKDGVRKVSWAAIVTGTLQADFTLPHVFEEKTDVEVVVTRALGAGTIVAFHGHGILVGPNADL